MRRRVAILSVTALILSGCGSSCDNSCDKAGTVADAGATTKFETKEKLESHQLKDKSSVAGETFTNYKYHNIGTPKNLVALQARADNA